MKLVRKKDLRIVGNLKSKIVQLQFMDYCPKGTCLIKIGNNCKYIKE